MARYRLVNKMALYHSTAAATPAGSPDQTEIGSATNLIGSSSGEAMSSMTGWAAQPAVIDAPDFTTNIVGNVAGDVTLPQSTISFYADDASSTIRDLFTDDLGGYIWIGVEGSANGDECLDFPATVLSNIRRFERNEAAQFDVAFSISPSVDGTFLT